jgi:hypothetical protein
MKHGRGAASLIATNVLIGALVIGLAGCSSGGPSGSTPSDTPPPSSGPAPTQGPTAPGPVTTQQAVREWILHWARAFVTLGQEVVVFRQAERSGDLGQMARRAAPIQGSAHQVSVGISLAPAPPPYLIPRVRRALQLLMRVERAVRSVLTSCRPAAGGRCRTAGAALYDLTDTLLAAFASILREGGFPIPTPS